MRILLRDVRLAFPSLWKASKPKGQQEGEAAFSGSFLIPPNHKQSFDPKQPNKKVATIDHLKTVVFKELAAAKWGPKGAAILKALEAADKTCLHNGDAKSEYEGFEGNFFISARSKVRPSVFDQQRQELTEADGKPYSGCQVNVSFEFWAQENGFGKRINAQLRGVQFHSDNDAFAGGSRPSDADEFDEIGVDGGGEEETTEEEDLTA